MSELIAVAREKRLKQMVGHVLAVKFTHAEVRERPRIPPSATIPLIRPSSAGGAGPAVSLSTAAATNPRPKSVRGRSQFQQSFRALAQHEFLDLAGGVPRQLAEYDLLRRLKCAEHAARMLDQCASLAIAPGFRVTNATGTSPHFGSGSGDHRRFPRPAHAPTARRSISTDAIFSPPR